MKKRSKEEMAAYKREWRKRKAATAPDQNVTPLASHPVTPSIPHTSAVGVPCPDCAARDQEIARLTAQVGALVEAQAQVDHVKGKAADTSLYEGVIAANKGGRITRCDTGRTIGTARV
jgi:hypothetical protein